MSEAPPPAPTRRSVLGGIAGLAALSSPTGMRGTAQPTAATPTVLTRNAYLGVDLFRLFRAESAAEFRRLVGDLLGAVDPAVYEARAGAIAAEVAATDADVVALQEAVLLRTGRPGDAGSDDSGPASDVLVDFLSLIQSALADRGLDYGTAAVTATTDVELPADTDEGRVDVRLTDRDALLVRGDLRTGDTATATFETSLPIPLPGDERTVSLERGYCSVDVSADDVGFTAVSTHLESVDPLPRRRQAGELLAALPTDRPVVVGGDFNSGPGTETGAYDLLTAELDDAHTTVDPTSEGFTCCQAGDLRNAESRLDRRIDALLYRGPVRPTAVGRVGHEPGDRVEVETGGTTVRLWPSDHAGVVGTFEVVEPTSTPTGTPTPSPTSEPTTVATAAPTRSATRPPTRTPASTLSPETTPVGSPTDGTPVPTTDGSGSGMGVVAAVVGLSTAVAARMRRG